MPLFPIGFTRHGKTPSNLPFACAFPTHTSQWLFGDWGVRAGARESPGRPLGWQPPGPGAVPGVVAAPPLPRRRRSRPAAPCLRHPRRKEGRRGGREKERGHKGGGGQGRRKKSIRHRRINRN